MATYVCGQLGIGQIHAVTHRPVRGHVARARGGHRLRQAVRRPVLVIGAEKFSDKIRNVGPRA